MLMTVLDQSSDTIWVVQDCTKSPEISEALKPKIRFKNAETGERLWVVRRGQSKWPDK